MSTKNGSHFYVNELNIHSKVDLERLPPPRVCLVPHVQRCNYRVACYKKADQPVFEKPKPYDQRIGWEKTGDDGILEPIWTVGPILPPCLIDILAQKEDLDTESANRNNSTSGIEDDGRFEPDDEEEGEINEIDFEDLFSDDDDEGDGHE